MKIEVTVEETYCKTIELEINGVDNVHNAINVAEAEVAQNYRLDMIKMTEGDLQDVQMASRCKETRTYTEWHSID